MRKGRILAAASRTRSGNFWSNPPFGDGASPGGPPRLAFLPSEVPETNGVT